MGDSLREFPYEVVLTPVHPSMKRAIGLAILAVAEDLKCKQELFLGEVAAITEGDSDLNGLSLAQKLYMLDVRRKVKSENPITVFCDRIAKGEAKPCRIIGSLRLHKAEKIGNPIHEAHLKAYRRMNSKARTRRIAQGEFLAWSDESREKRDACLNGELSLEEFALWLDADKKV